MIDAIAVVVPANNEAQLLPSCIHGLRGAVFRARQEHPEVTVTVVFALDRCTDTSSEVIESGGYRWVESLRVGVGAARATGVAAALADLGTFAGHRILISCTDADSIVPSDWLTQQIELANGGADVIVGGVRPNPGDLDHERERAWELTHRDDQALGHVHGANLGIRANFYLAVGGFASVLEHEDVDLVARAVAAGARVRATGSNRVITSGRLEGRTEGGYAGYLREQLIPLAESSPVEQSVA
jgi:GT2 family glycosyltransferase